MAYTEADPSELLHRARMQAGLTQGEVAQRADVSRQMVGVYERGGRQPSIATIERLLAACGVRLRLSLVPVPGLEDEPTRELLRLPVLNRLTPAHQEALILLAEAGPSVAQFVLTGKAGARLQGAAIRVDEVELVVNPACPPAEIAALLSDAHVVHIGRSRVVSPVVLTADRLRAGSWLVLDDVDLHVRSFEHYDGVRKRANSLQLLESLAIWVASSGHCASAWHPRDLDHLAVQRAWRLIQETP